MTEESTMIEKVALKPCPFCNVRPERLKNLDFSNSEAFWHPDDASVCILNGCSIHRDKWEGWNTRAAIEAMPLNVLREALEWYAEQVAGCRKIGSIGEPFRSALDSDGGKRARAALERVSLSPQELGDA